jgi:processive 1,2-diacylglycerol beta-glucosyltransferase
MHIRYENGAVVHEKYLSFSCSMSSLRVIFCAVSVGSGHIRASESVMEYFPNSKLFDLLEHTPRWFSKIYRDGYLLAVKWFPQIVGWCYTFTDTHHLKTGGIVSWIEDWITRKFQKEIIQANPEVIVSTHFFTSKVLTRMCRRKQLKIPVVTVITDIHPHLIWLTGESDYFCVANCSAVTESIQKGISPEKIYCTGIPVNSHFYEYSSKPIASADNFKILITGGGAGVGEIQGTVQHILNRIKHANVTVVCGNNITLKQALSEIKSERLQIVGFTKSMHTLMHQADVLVCKPGGLTTAEAITIGVPMILMQPIPGQEEKNAQNLIAAGAAVSGYTPEAVCYILNALIKAPELLSEMRISALQLRVTNSAQRIADLIKSSVV